MDMIFWGLFERIFANKHSVFGNQTKSLTLAVHSNAARLCLSAVVPQTARFGYKQMQMGSAGGERRLKKG